MKIDEIVSRFNTPPFLFVGSGLSRRYLGTPNWEGLLEVFAKRISNDPFIYHAYVNKAKSANPKVGILPKVAQLIQYDFDNKWFSDPAMRTNSDDIINAVKNGCSPFKAEVAAFFKKHTIINDTYTNEVKLLKEISTHSIAGIITTNYDSFLEKVFEGYSRYVGQNELIFSAIQGIAEIYKIHGSNEQPESLIINEDDYLDFDAKSKYLAAKLLTIFMEYPIIFIGYSISDTNIQNIIHSIVDCLDESQINRLEDRFIFVEYNSDFKKPEVSLHSIMVNEKPLYMKRIVLSDFSVLYTSLSNVKSKLPVRILRRFKQELYNYTITSAPTSNLRVASIEDDRVDDEELVIAIGRADELGLRGLSGIDIDDWYTHLILNNLHCTADDLFQYAYVKLHKQNSGLLPIYKYLSQTTHDFPEITESAKSRVFEDFTSNSIRKNRRCVDMYSSVKEVWKAEKHNLSRATNLLTHLREEQISVDELEEILYELFNSDVNVLKNVNPNVRTHIRRLIRFYDYLKWGKVKEPSDSST